MSRGDGGAPSYSDTLLAQSGKRFRARMREMYPQLTDESANKAVDSVGVSPSPPPSPPKVPEHPLESVVFASEAARRLADAEGLTWMDFAQSNVPASGRSGYRVRDVAQVVAKRT